MIYFAVAAACMWWRPRQVPVVLTDCARCHVSVGGHHQDEPHFASPPPFLQAAGRSAPAAAQHSSPTTTSSAGQFPSCRLRLGAGPLCHHPALSCSPWHWHCSGVDLHLCACVVPHSRLSRSALNVDGAARTGSEAAAALLPSMVSGGLKACSPTPTHFPPGTVTGVVPPWSPPPPCAAVNRFVCFFVTREGPLEPHRHRGPAPCPGSPPCAAARAERGTSGPRHLARVFARCAPRGLFPEGVVGHFFSLGSPPGGGAQGLFSSVRLGGATTTTLRDRREGEKRRALAGNTRAFPHQLLPRPGRRTVPDCARVWAGPLTTGPPSLHTAGRRSRRAPAGLLLLGRRRPVGAAAAAPPLHRLGAQELRRGAAAAGVRAGVCVGGCVTPVVQARPLPPHFGRARPQ